MSLPCWQERAEKDASAPEPETIPYAKSKKLFAVDCSDSTHGAVLATERDAVRSLSTSPQDMICLWDYDCDIPSVLATQPDSYFVDRGGTYPSSILRQPAAVNAIKGSDLWFLLTDGEVASYEVENLTRLAEQQAITQVPVVLLIVGKRRLSPQNENISVGISFFASARDALFLYKGVHDSGYYLLDAKGAFAGLKHTDTDLSDWDKLTQFKNVDDLKNAFESAQVALDADRSKRHLKGVTLGPEWDTATDHALVKVTELLEQSQLYSNDLINLLQEEAITQLALICKIRGQLNDLRQLLIRHKQQEVIVRLEDRHGASKIMAAIQASSDQSEKLRLSDQLREAHAANRASYQRLKDFPSDETKQIMTLNRLIDRGLQVISGFEKSGYTADILNRKSNRARRAGMVTSADAEVKLAALDLSESVPSLRGSCSICCGDKEIMSVALKKLDTVEENTTDFALNFPLAAAHAKQNKDIVSTQTICFQCALLLDRSIYHEEIVARLPVVEFKGPNKKYIVNQLYSALTAGLATGMSGVVQLFATILDRTLETKSWCAKDIVDDVEALARRQVLEWMFHDLLTNCPCRENFAETGQWVKLPDALRWAVRDYQEAGLDSWIIQYPIAGFTTIMRFYDVLDLRIPQDSLIAIRHSKLIHLVTSKIKGRLLKPDPDDKDWRHPFMALIYREFQAPCVPRDLGSDSLVISSQFWIELGSALEADTWSDVHHFLQLFNDDTSKSLVDRVQAVVFWALFTQKSHTMPKTFFANLKLREPVAPAILNSTAPLPTQSTKDILSSIFCTSKRTDPAFVLHNTGATTPFVSPYGPSVLQCGQSGCNTLFYTEDDLADKEALLVDKIREARKKHLAEVFAAGGEDGEAFKRTSQTGLPDATIVPKAPSSTHSTLHISTAKTWARLPLSERRDLATAIKLTIATATDSDSHSSDDTSLLLLNRFVESVCEHICRTSGRGNIYSCTLQAQVREVLPSFLVALEKASSRKMALEDESGGCGFEFCWKENTVGWKMKWEMDMLQAEGSGGSGGSGD